MRGSEQIHIALVKLSQADTLPSATVLPGLARTLIHLGRLGMPVCVVVEPEDLYGTGESLSCPPTLLRDKYMTITTRLTEAIESQGGRAVPILGDVLAQIEHPIQTIHKPSNSVARIVSTVEQSILAAPSTMSHTGRALLYSLMKRSVIPVLAPVAGGINPALMSLSADGTLYRICKELSNPDDKSSPSKISIERVIVIDPVGGLPARERRGGSHLYINLQQEYNAMVHEICTQLLSRGIRPAPPETNLHLRNLVLLKHCLATLGASSSALITTPTIASASPSESAPQSLIHNLLTDKPLVSPSLPARRLTTPKSKTTLLRHGLPIFVYTDLESDIGDERPLNFSRLIALIEDSFGRRLDVDHYWDRIKDKTAAVIVAGEYEGAAIITRETPPHRSDNEWIPYLDKFAVSTKSQGSGSVADIVFNVMTSMFSKDLIWRSRRNNPVNKWV